MREREARNSFSTKATKDSDVGDSRQKNAKMRMKGIRNGTSPIPKMNVGNW
jgi:hypothetical protein